ncbi:RNA-binding protein RO60-like [Littorina saxatilis]|uniref:TROVE domain-containing protein n=1 Tax=Littorina saxatilis TaxID=31220 RepID=A0AAN9BVV5_9CAEN
MPKDHNGLTTTYTTYRDFTLFLLRGILWIKKSGVKDSSLNLLHVSQQIIPWCLGLIIRLNMSARHLYDMLRHPFDPYNSEDEEDEELEKIMDVMKRATERAQAVPSCDTGQDPEPGGSSAPLQAGSSAQPMDTTASQSSGSLPNQSGSSTTGSQSQAVTDSAVVTLTSQLAGTKMPATDLSTPSTSQSVIVKDLSGDGLSPKRKASESDDGGDGEVGNQPAHKEARREGGEGGKGDSSSDAGPPPPPEEKREDVNDLIRMLNHHRRRPVSPHREQLFMQCSRDVIGQMKNELFYSQNRRIEKLRARNRRGEPRRPQSDEDSDEETLRQNPALPVPQVQAKFPVTDRQKLLRLLILGGIKVGRGRADDPTKNPDFNTVKRMITDGEGVQVVDLLKDVSVKGRSAKQDGLVYGLALCCRTDNMDTKRAAYAAIQDMCRTPTQIFQLIKYIETYTPESSGWGRGLRRAMCMWYNAYGTNPLRLAMHVTKYWQRHDWCHRDVFRLCHIKPANDAIGFIIRYAVKDMKEAEKFYLEDGYLGRDDLEKVHKYLKAVEEAKQCQDVERTSELIKEHDLVREQLRTEMLNEPDIWSVMLPSMPLTALIRNLGKMSFLNLFDDPERTQIVISKLNNVNAMKKARVHPFKLLLAHHIYKQGHGEKGSLNWPPNQEILAALESAFYKSFEAVEPTNKRILIALDISGSMTSRLMETPIEIREAATLMAMVTFRREPNCDIVGFHSKLIPLEMFKDENKTLDQLVSETHRLGFGSTDCSKPMTWARKHGKEYDAFIIYTDSETNSHRVPPYAALDKYRQTMNIPTAKLVVVGMSPHDFSIARPDDLHMMDVVGFDSDTPGMISEFLNGGLE